MHWLLGMPVGRGGAGQKPDGGGIFRSVDEILGILHELR